MTLTRSLRFGASWLLGMGLLISALVVYGFATSRWACAEASGNGFACDLSNIAVVIGAIFAALHLVAAAGIRRGRVWAAALGAIVALLGVIACVSLVANESWWLVLPPAAGYLGASLVLAYGIARWWVPG